MTVNMAIVVSVNTGRKDLVNPPIEPCLGSLANLPVWPFSFVPVKVSHLYVCIGVYRARCVIIQVKKVIKGNTTPLKTRIVLIRHM